MVIALVVGLRAGEARALVFHDLPAFIQRISQIYQAIVQVRQLTNGFRDNLQAFKQAYEGLKDWRNMGWLDTLNLLESPWLDKVEGIEDIRNVAMLSVMTAEQAGKLWGDAASLKDWQTSKRYRTDPWFRRKIDSLFRQSRRARARRVALLRMLQAENQQLIDDVKKIDKLRDEIRKENERATAAKRPVNQGLIASLQAQIAATEAKHQGHNLMLKNQRAIMFLVGEDDAQRVYMETTQSDWLDGNQRALGTFGKGFWK